MDKDENICCPEFKPETWDNQTVVWENKAFVQDRVRSFLHIPLTFGAAMKRCCTAIQDADAADSETIVLADENSLWGADVYVSVSKEVPKTKMASISGTFIAKVFEGPFKNMRCWINEMNSFVKQKGMPLKKMYFYYTTCPKCAKKYGKNYVVILAQVQK
jgi:hypothetical protein